MSGASMAASRMTGNRKILAVLLDITGVLYESGEGDGKVIKGSPEAVLRLRSAGYPLLFCSNETQVTRKALVEKLQRLGFDLKEEEVHSPMPACRQFLQENNLRPYLIVHPSALADYDGIDTSNPNAVVLGDAASAFNYDTLNRAFRILTDQPGSTLISLGQGRYYREGGALTLDVGPFTKALEYATGMEAKVIGKPSREFFSSAVKRLGMLPENTMMVGDDVVNDVGGAQSCGLFGVLVRTGKYRPEDENHPTVKPNRIVTNLAEAVELLIQ